MNNEPNKRDNIRLVKTEAETEQLKRILRRAVTSERVPEDLSKRISRMIREA